MLEVGITPIDSRGWECTLAKAILTIGAQGNVRTETLRAFTEEEFRQLIAALP